MKWHKKFNGLLSIVVAVVLLDVIGGMVLPHDVSWYYRWGVGLGATVSLLLYVIITERVKK